ncbi:hypothetical protein PE066_13715 [Ramlibacter tataouinensis]|uniref:hypothetical protein n=1 Tax=Ramlibacter tataouinensis TaxID=94132 RepID=UPI0022F3DC9D|nr:hypothetical protein [Ramlibacter tataouinensis]WBY00522.1 hypothetical protein PE066_13715 [Ramlibacter tataouinensis]
MDVTVATRRRISELLEQFWDERAIQIETTGTVEDLIDEIDSLSAVDALIPIEDLLNIDIEAAKVIRRGGYDSKEQFVNELTASVVRYAEALS